MTTADDASRPYTSPSHFVLGIIYKITHKQNGKVYVGQTQTHRWNHGKWRPYGIKRRFGAHYSKAKAGVQNLLYQAMREDGSEAFNIEEIMQCSLLERNKYEYEWTIRLNSLSPNGYNLVPGGGAGTSRINPKSIDSSKKAEVRKRKFDDAFDPTSVSEAVLPLTQTSSITSFENQDGTVNNDPVVCAHIREVQGVAPKFNVFFETETCKIDDVMRRSTFSSRRGRDQALSDAKAFAARYTDKISVIETGQGRFSRGDKSRQKTLDALGDDQVTRIHLACLTNGKVRTYFETAAANTTVTMNMTQFQYAEEAGGQAMSLKMAVEWVTQIFPDVPLVVKASRNATEAVLSVAFAVFDFDPVLSIDEKRVGTAVQMTLDSLSGKIVLEAYFSSQVYGTINEATIVARRWCQSVCPTVIVSQ